MSLDASLTSFAMDDPGDAQLLVKFAWVAKEDKQKSLEEGRYISKQVVWIEARPMGKQRNLFSRQATARDLERFKDRYERWMKDEEDPVEGTPIDEWPAISITQKDEFKHRGIRSVEDILLVNDTVAQDFMGFNHIRRMAEQFVETGATKKAAEAIIERDAEIAQLKEAVAKLTSALEGAAEPKPKRKRRTKAEMSADKVLDSVCEDAAKESREALKAEAEQLEA